MGHRRGGEQEVGVEGKGGGWGSRGRGGVDEGDPLRPQTANK